MTDSKNPLMNSAVFLAGTTAFLYCVSTAYYNGYLDKLKLDVDVLDRNFHQVLYNGLIISFAPVFFLMLGYSTIRVFHAHLINDWLRAGMKNKRRFLEMRRWIRVHSGGNRQRVFIKKRTVLELAQEQKTLNAIYFTVFVIIFLFMLVYFENQGASKANEVLKLIDSNKSKESSSLIRVKTDDQFKSLWYLGCGARNCAGIDPISKTVYYFPQNGHSYQLAPVASVPSILAPAASSTPAPVPVPKAVVRTP